MQSYFDSLDMRLVIPSRGRAQEITTHKILPSATLVVPASEAAEYEHTGLMITKIPDAITGVGPVRNWVLANFKEEIIVMADDDITNIYCITGKRARRIEDPETVYQVIAQAARCAKDLGTAAFGFNQAWDVRKYHPAEPFSLTGWAGGVVGVIGRELRFLEDQKFRVDVDFFLLNMLHRRIIWKDERFSFYQVRETNRGGNSQFKTTEALNREIRKLQNRWGRYFKYTTTKRGENTNTKVTRRQVVNV